MIFSENSTKSNFQFFTTLKEINQDAAATATEHTTQQNRTDDAEMVNDSDTSASNGGKCYNLIK